MTLIQNKNNILPLKKSTGKIDIIGPNANDNHIVNPQHYRFMKMQISVLIK